MTYLGLSNCGVGSDGARAIAAALMRTRAPVESCDLSQNPIGDAGATALAGAVLVCTCLRELSLGQRAVARAELPDDTAIITDSGARLLAEAVASNSSMSRYGVWSGCCGGR